MNTTLSGPMVAPATGKAERLMVLLHGYGSDGNDLISLAGMWKQEFPQMLFVAPNAPDPCDINPAGFQWFPLAMDRMNSRIVGAKTARASVEQFLQALWKQTGLGAAETLLMGFSQGAMVALDVGLRLETQLKGIMSFSGGVVADQALETEIRSRPPVCFIHGKSDAVVPIQMSEYGYDLLKGLNFQVAKLFEEGVEHTISVSGLGFALAFMRELEGKEGQSK